jgi:two-component sensor histidine kinase
VLQSVASGALGEFTAPGTDGVSRLYAVSAIPYYDLHVLFGVPEAQLLDPLFWKVATQVLVILGAWLVALLAVLPGARWVVTRWTDRLTESARAMSKGDLAARPELAGAPEELRLLGETLAGLASRVQRREAELGAALAQHKTMLREVHHRVKNNLQTVTSLLNLHAKGPRAAPARQVFADVQVRINALALVHRHLYESDDMSVVALRPFLTGLCRLVQDGTAVSPRQVALALDIEEVSVPGDTAVPIALLVTEILTNAFKHGFPAGRSGAIGVRLARADDATAVLTVEDNGVGQAEPEQALEPGANGIGFSLIRAFVRQLDGDLAFEGPPGTAVTVRFPLVRRAGHPAEEPEDLGEEERERADEIGAVPRSEDRGTGS